MSETRNNQEEMMELLGMMDELRTERKGRRPHGGPRRRPSHGPNHEGCEGAHHGPHHEGCEGPHHGPHHEGCEGPHHGPHHEGCERPPHGMGRELHPSARKLLSILLREEKLNQRNIASMMHITAQAVSEMIKKLERRELISKESGEINNENMISLTEIGREIAERIVEEDREYVDTLFQDFTEEEISTFYNLVERVYKNKIKFSENNYK